MSPSRRNGFVLAEIMPAFLLFIAFLLAGFRMLWMQTRIERAAWTEHLTKDAVLLAWNTWSEWDGKAALVVMDGEANWKTYVLPDEDWIPDAGGERTAPDDFEVILRRRKDKMLDGTDVWRLEQFLGDGEWRIRQPVLLSPMSQSAGEDLLP